MEIYMTTEAYPWKHFQYHNDVWGYFNQAYGILLLNNIKH